VTGKLLTMNEIGIALGFTGVPTGGVVISFTS
jgi:hypothetical protein